MPFQIRKTLICVPTYNERENLPLLLTEIHATVPHVHVLVIDDNSPDGTGGVADGLARDDAEGRVHVLHRPGKQGLGKAYIAGFLWALEQDYELIFEMDCDFSHQPRHLPEFLEKAETCDLVLGSRYIPGGGTVDWSMSRKLISKGGNTYARLILGLPFKDLTGGFKCFRRAVIEKLDLDHIVTAGYGFQIELTYRAAKMGFEVSETQIVFPDRTRGQSRMSKKIVAEAMANL